MKIKKLGHCCLLIEEKGLRILTDPGSYSTGQNDITNIDVVLITHEHADHLHVDSLRQVLLNNPQAQIITNKGVGAILDKESIQYALIEEGQNITVKDILIEGCGKDHEHIYESMGLVENTGYFVDNKLFYPGDAFYEVNKAVDILALPVAGPWMQLSDAIDYAKKIKPRICFPVHDGMLKEDRIGSAHKFPEAVLNPLGIEFVAMKEGDSKEF